MRVKHIAAVLEPFEERQPALDRAVELAGRSHARLELHCVDSDAGSRAQARTAGTATAGGRDLSTGDVSDWMDELRGELLGLGLEITTVASYGRPYYEHVVEHVREDPPDLLVKATHAHSALERNYFAASEWRLIARCPVPLLLVKHGLKPGPIIAAIDPFHEDDKPAELDRRILELACALAELLGRELLVVHAVSLDAPLPVVGAAYLGRVRSETERLNRHVEAVRQLVRPYGVPSEALHVVAGTPEEVIAGAAERHDACVIVMGALSRSSLAEMLIGNTAERVLEDVASDLLVIPTQPAAA